MKVAAIIRAIGELALHVAALAVVFFAFAPIASWYYAHRPILGVDFFNTVTHVRLFAEELNLPMWAFRYFWFGGSPLYTDFSIGWYYPIALVAQFVPLLSAVKLSLLVSFFLFLVFTYLAAHRLSNHQFFSAAVTILVAFSPNLFGSLTWGGSLPYFANQLFYPLALWLLASYLETGKRRWFWGAALAVGLSILGHAKNAGAFILPSTAVVFLFGIRRNKLGFKRRVVELLVFIFAVILLSSRVSIPLFTGVIGAALEGNILNPFGAAPSLQFGEAGGSVSGQSAVAVWERGQFGVLAADTNQWLFYLVGLALAVVLVALVADREKRRVVGILPWFLILAYGAFHVYANSHGFPFLQQGWYRAFWHFPVALALFVASLVGYSLSAFSRASKTLGRVASIALMVFCVALLGVVYRSQDWERTIEVVEAKSSPSSAYPEAINLVRDDAELKALEDDLTPAWLNPNDRNWRLYDSDAQVNVWWNGLFDMPLVRGYIDPPVGTDRMGNIFLTDQAVGADGLVTNFDYPEDVARNMALYYIDWNALRYFEGGHVSISDNKAPSSYLADAIVEEAQAETIGLYRLYETESGKPEIQDIPQYLHYYRFADELVSPVLSVSQASTLLCLCDWPAYESLTKVLSMQNINSQKLVTIYADRHADSFSPEELSSFDVIYMSGYTYRDQYRAFSRLTDYVTEGGKLIIDTGGEVREAESIDLPSLFPFAGTSRTGLGKVWDLDSGGDALLKGVRLEFFSPPVFDGMDWKLSYPQGEVDPDARVLLRHQGHPIIVTREVGEGSLVWMGMNLAYHIHANTNMEEAKLFLRLLETLQPLEEHEYVPGTPEFVSSRLVRFHSDRGGRGLLFKEQFYPGWFARVNGKRRPAYSSGPAYPGYLYVPLAEDGPVTAEFEYWGRGRWYAEFIFTLALSFVILDLVFGGRVVGNRTIGVGKRLLKRFSKWWEHEEEY